jgi:gliding motility-associated-like protein
VVRSFCTPTDTVTVPVTIGQTITYCPDVSELQGNIVSITNVCPTNSGTNAVVTLDNVNNCLIINGLNIGTDTACIQICDDFGVCDTTIIVLQVIPSTDIIYVTVPVDDTTDICIPTDQLLGNVANVTDLNCATPTLGSYTLNDTCIVYDAGSIAGTSDSICIVITDDQGNTDTTIVVVTVTDSVNFEGPIAIDDINLTTVNTPTLGNVLTNDISPDGDSIYVGSIVTQPINGGVVNINPDGSYTYTPAQDFIGTDIFTYVVCEASTPALCDTADVVINVIDPDSEEPIANNDNALTYINTPIIVNVANNDLSPTGAPLTVVSTPVTPPTNGTVTSNPDGTFTYSPDPTFTGTDEFTYAICDNAVPAQCDTATVTITVIDNPIGGGNRPPVAIDDANTTDVVTPVSGNVLPNDSDPDGDNLVVTGVIDQPSNGTVFLNPDGSYTYFPDSSFTGTVTWTYQVCDDGSPVLCTEATVYILINPENQPPLALNDINVTLINTPVNGNVLTNDSDPDGDVITVTTTLVTPPTNGGTVTIDSVGNYTYEPATGFTGTDVFVYEVCDDGNPSLCDTAIVTINIIDPVTGANNPPVANNDNAVTNINTPVNGDVINNDIDPDGDGLVVTTTPIDSTDNGSVVIAPDGTFTYTPDSGFVGTDEFTYQVCDTLGACDTATVFITVLPNTNGNENDAPIAVDDANVTDVNTPVNGNVLPNDSDPNGDNLTVTPATVTTPNGTVTIDGNGDYTYTPNTGYFGPDQFTYEVCDDGTPSLCANATVIITILEGNNPPVAIDDINNTLVNTPVNGNMFTNDSDPDGDSFTVTEIITDPINGSIVTIDSVAGTYTYEPVTDFVGNDQFTYVICDNGTPALCDTAVVYISIFKDSVDVNDPPVANNDIYTAIENTPLTSDVLANDFDVDSDSITINTTPIDSTDNGSLTINPDGTFTYVPDSGFTGVDNFMYSICDTAGLCDTALVVITVNPNNADNNPPVAVDDANVTTVNTPVSDNVLPNDSDPDGDNIAVTPNSGATPNGTFTVDANGGYTYTPNAGYTGPDQFTYTICDDGTPTACDDATVYITILPDNSNSAPIAVNDINNTLAEVPVSGSVVTNDIEPNGDLLVVDTALVLIPMNGTIVIDSTGDYTYTPNAGFTGLDSFIYVVCDNQTPALCDTATAYITVIDISDEDNNPPVANNDYYITLVDVAINGVDITNNDFDPDGDNIVVAPITSPANGTVTFPMGGMGMINYVPNAGFTGLDTFYYRICDVPADPTIMSLCDTAMVVIEILPNDNGPKNDPPFAGDDAYVTTVNVPVNGQVLPNDFDPNGDSLIVTTTIVSGPDSGSVVIAPNGLFVYTPNNNFFGTDQFVYEVCDDGAPIECVQATVYITVLPEANTMIDTVIVYVPVSTDSTFCLDASELPGNVVNIINLGCDPTLDFGIANNFTNGCFDYIANALPGSADTICVVIEDQFGNLDTTIYLVNVYDDSPITIDTIPVSILASTTDTFCIPLDQLVGFPVNISEIGCDPTIVWGTIDGLTDSCFIYTAIATPGGQDTVCIVAEDAVGNLDTTVFLITVVKPVTDTLPVVIYTNTDTVICIDGVYDLAGTIVSVTDLNCSPVDDGTLANIDPNGCITYQANGVAGNDTICIVVCDDQGFCDTTIIPITIIPAPDTIYQTVDLQDTVVNCMDVTELPGTITSITVCNAPDTGIFSINTGINGLDTTCVTYISDSLYIGSDTACIIICDDQGFCDTTIIIYNVEPDCSTFDFIPATLALVADTCANGAEVCLPYDPTTFERVLVTLDGGIVNLGDCNNGASTSITLPVGSNMMLVMTDTVSGCSDTSMVAVTCQPTDTIRVTVLTNTDSVLCVTADDLPGGAASIVSMVDICNGVDNGILDLNLADATCFEYLAGGVAGIDTACIVVCDASGVCDTTIYIVTVIPTPDTVTITLNLGTDSTHCIPVPELPGNIDDVFVGCGNPINATLSVNPPDTCIIIDATALGADTTCIVICDDQGFCDTTYLIINVLNALDAPVALNDTIDICTTATVYVTDNDTINGTVESVTILSLPSRGVANVNVDFSIDYEAIDEVPYIDSFTYVICNASLCDTATVIVNGECSGPIKVNTGFSPNGDNMNDTWIIDGIENYPDNKVMVFNRWGNLVYEKAGYLNDWDGTWRGDNLPDGTYFYYVEVDINGKVEIFSGYLQIHR